MKIELLKNLPLVCAVYGRFALEMDLIGGEDEDGEAAEPVQATVWELPIFGTDDFVPHRLSVSRDENLKITVAGLPGDPDGYTREIFTEPPYDDRLNCYFQLVANLLFGWIVGQTDPEDIFDL